MDVDTVRKHADAILDEARNKVLNVICCTDVIEISFDLENELDLAAARLLESDDRGYRGSKKFIIVLDVKETQVAL